MAISVSSYTNIGTGWFSTTTPRSSSGISWSQGDIVVVVGGAENALGTMGNPSNANLTFGAAKASSTSGGGLEAEIYVWASDPAASAQTGQSIQSTATAGSMFGHAVIVVTGNPVTFANATANLTESSISRTVGQGSVGIFALIDFNATNPPGKTPLTGSGTAVERLDQGNGTNYAQYIATWEGMSAGTFSFGPNNYTSLQVAQIFIEVTAPPETLGTTPGVFPRRVPPGDHLSPGGFRNWRLQRPAEVSSAAATNAPAESASATATANNAQTSIAPNAASASATATANNAQANIAPSAGSASATATANGAQVTIASSAGSASATATANGATSKVSPTAGSASATATANDATATSGTFTNASAVAASASATASDPSAKVSPSASSASATATANDASAKVSATAGSASATATANTAQVSISVTAGSASATASASGATVSVKATAGSASATATANTAAVSTGDVFVTVVDQRDVWREPAAVVFTEPDRPAFREPPSHVFVEPAAERWNEPHPRTV